MEGTLHVDRFFCPGIHEECIEVNGAFITPKTFSIMGDKVRLKNWKNAVRINGKNIRKLMDTGELDFHNHGEVCTGKCMSRNSGMSKYDIAKYVEGTVDLDVPSMVPFSSKHNGDAYSDDAGTYLNEGSSGSSGPCSGPAVFPGQPLPSPSPSPVPSPSPAPVSPINNNDSSCKSPSPKPTDLSNVVIKEEPTSDNESSVLPSELTQQIRKKSKHTVLGQLLGGAPTLPPGAIPIHVSNGQPPAGQFILTPNGLVQLQPVPLDLASTLATTAATMTASTVVKSAFMQGPPHVLDFPEDIDVMEDSQSFWQGILNVGLIDDFFREMKYGLDALKHELIKSNGGAEECTRASKIVNQLGMVNKLKLKLNAHKLDTEKQKNKLNLELELLRKRVQDAEQRQALLKRKSDCFDHLIEAGTPKQIKSQSPEPVSTWSKPTALPIVTAVKSTTKTSRKSANPTKSQPEALEAPVDMQSESSVKPSARSIRRSSRSKKQIDFSKYERDGVATDLSKNSSHNSIKES